MTISIEQNEITDAELRHRVETAIRECIGDRPKEDDWRVSIRQLGGHSEIIVKGPVQTRRNLFFEAASSLPEKVREWLRAYPLR